MLTPQTAGEASPPRHESSPTNSLTRQTNTSRYGPERRESRLTPSLPPPAARSGADADINPIYPQKLPSSRRTSAIFFQTKQRTTTLSLDTRARRLRLSRTLPKRVLTHYPKKPPDVTQLATLGSLKNRVSFQKILLTA